MIKLILINSVVIFIAAYLLKGVEVKDFFTAVGVAILLAIINTFIKPVLVFLTLPVTVVTLGLFLIVINAAIILFISKIISEFKVDGFWWAAVFSIIISVMNAFLHRVF